MNVIIIEDEQITANNLERLLLEIDSKITILAKLESIRASVKWLSQNSCDLIFMDIHLSDGNSFSIFEQTEVKIPVIFTTAYDQYAIKAFKHNSIDYLLKPINQKELEQSIKKFKETKIQSQTPDITSLIRSIQSPQVYQERFLVNAGQKLKTIKTTDIAYFYVQEKGVFLCTFENKNYDLSYTLDKLEEMLDPRIFFRINRQFIVHIDSIEQMHTVSKSRLKLDTKPHSPDEMIVSFNNVHAFREWLNK
jgi:DNA-binding LytR/AlgR family response regulator